VVAVCAAAPCAPMARTSAAMPAINPRVILNLPSAMLQFLLRLTQP
jgi:hypothetical protein